MPIASYTYFHYAYEFNTRKLAYMLYSLVRVSRRVISSHFYMIAEKPLSQKNGSSERLAAKHVYPNQITDHAFYQRNTQKVQSAVASPEVTPRLQLSTKSDRPKTNNTLDTLPSQRFQVFSPSFQSSFHLSFTVLVCYRFPINI